MSLLADKLKNQNASVRVEAIREIAASGRREFAQPLLEMLGKPEHWMVQKEAAVALGAINPGLAAEELPKRLPAAKPAVQLGIVEALVSANAEKKLLEFLNGTSVDELDRDLANSIISLLKGKFISLKSATAGAAGGPREAGFVQMTDIMEIFRVLGKTFSSGLKDTLKAAGIDMGIRVENAIETPFEDEGDEPELYRHDECVAEETPASKPEETPAKVENLTNEKMQIIQFLHYSQMGTATPSTNQRALEHLGKVFGDAGNYGAIVEIYAEEERYSKIIESELMKKGADAAGFLGMCLGSYAHEKGRTTGAVEIERLETLANAAVALRDMLGRSR